VKKRGDGRSASPTVRLKGKKDLGERVPWELFGGRPGAVAPPASFNVQEVLAQTDRVATPVRARVVGGEGGGEWMVLGSGWGKDGFCGGWFCILFSFCFLSVYI
jgi:hypothetical protein